MIKPDAGNLGGKVGFIFLATGLAASIGGWYLFPETKSLPFQKLDELYALKIPACQFKKAAQDTEAFIPPIGIGKEEIYKGRRCSR